MESERLAFESQIRDLFGRAAYTHKTHEKQAEKLAAKLWLLKFLQLLVAALTAAAAGISVAAAPEIAILGKSVSYSLVALVLSFLSLAFSTYMKDFDPATAAQKHRESAVDIWSIREGYLSLITDLQDPSLCLGDLRKRRDDLEARYHQILSKAPQTDESSFSKAQKALKEKEELTFAEKELDSLLPGALKKNGSRKTPQKKADNVTGEAQGQGEDKSCQSTISPN